MISAMHEIARHREIVIKKPPKGSEKGEIFDPNSFPIQRLTGDLIEEYESIWNLEKEILMK